MVSVILETNIYGRIVEDRIHGADLVERISADPAFIVVNFRVIRKELRRAPRFLPVYDKLVSRRIIDESQAIKRLAEAYFATYKANNGVQSKRKILNDFMIVACATLKGCDLVCSDDRRTLQHPVALQAYRVENLKRRLRTPNFFSYDDLKRSFL